MRSVCEREIAWLQRFGRFRHPREPLYRAFYSHQEVDPEVQKQSLRDYLRVVPLVIPEQSEFNLPTVRHPDLSPNNIFVSNSGDITGLIDWQHTSILPLFLQAKIPKHFQNWGDDESESMRPPRLPDNFDSMAASEKEAELEVYRRRQTHYFYMGYTGRNNETHFNALGKAGLAMTNKLFDTAARPWEGDNTSLKAEIIRASRHWSDMRSSQAKSHDFPVHYTEEEVTKCLAIDNNNNKLMLRCKFFVIASPQILTAGSHLSYTSRSGLERMMYEHRCWRQQTQKMRGKTLRTIGHFKIISRSIET